MRLLLVALAMLVAAAGASASALFNQLAKEYQDHGGVALVAGDAAFPVKLEAGVIAAKNVLPGDIDLYLYLFRKEFGKYPATLFPLVGLKRVVFCRDLTFKGAARAAVADSEHGALYLDVRSGVYSSAYRHKVVHREFFQLIAAASRDGSGDAGWVALNPAGTLYGRGKPVAPGDNAGAVITHPTAGFINAIAQTSVDEDKAQIFANLMVNDLKTRLLLRQDTVLVAKIQLLKEQLRQFCKEADASFWQRVEQDF